MKDKFIEFFLGKTTIVEEQKLMDWTKESKKNEDELINSVNLFMQSICFRTQQEKLIPPKIKEYFFIFIVL